MILPDIAFNGVINFGVYEEKATIAPSGATAAANKFEPTIENAGGAAVRSKYVAGNNPTRPAELTKVTINGSDTPSLDDTEINKVLQDSRPFIYQGASYKYENGKYSQLTANNGHLGCIDSPECIDRLYGVNAYSAAPSPLIVGHRKM